jgi:hypothetical protein
MVSCAVAAVSLCAILAADINSMHVGGAGMTKQPSGAQLLMSVRGLPVQLGVLLLVDCSLLGAQPAVASCVPIAGFTGWATQQH